LKFTGIPGTECSDQDTPATTGNPETSLPSRSQNNRQDGRNREQQWHPPGIRKATRSMATRKKPFTDRELWKMTEITPVNEQREAPGAFFKYE